MSHALTIFQARATATTPLAEHGGKGVVLIFRGHVYGWKDCLRDARHERPGALAVGGDGRVHEARGGNDRDGAQRWSELVA